MKFRKMSFIAFCALFMGLSGCKEDKHSFSEIMNNPAKLTLISKASEGQQQAFHSELASLDDRGLLHTGGGSYPLQEFEIVVWVVPSFLDVWDAPGGVIYKNVFDRISNAEDDIQFNFFVNANGLDQLLIFFRSVDTSPEIMKCIAQNVYASILGREIVIDPKTFCLIEE